MNKSKQSLAKAQRRKAAKAAKHKSPVFFALFAAWRLCENTFSYFERFFHTFLRPEPLGKTPVMVERDNRAFHLLDFPVHFQEEPQW